MTGNDQEPYEIIGHSQDQSPGCLVNDSKMIFFKLDPSYDLCAFSRCGGEGKILGDAHNHTIMALLCGAGSKKEILIRTALVQPSQAGFLQSKDRDALLRKLIQ